VKLAYDPVERHRKIEPAVIQERVGGDLKKYYRFRRDHWYGGVITADCAGCGLTCKFCWVRKESILEGREGGEFLKPDEAARRVLELMKEKKINQGRISGGEPTIGRRHLIQFLNVLQRRRVRFILETNGILIGEDESYAQELAQYPFLHVRVSLKGCTESEFSRLTGADPKGFHLQLNALRNLKKGGVSAHPSVMSSFSGREEIDQLYSTIWKIDPILHSEIEKEEVILYPYVVERLRRAGLEYYSGHLPERSGRDAGGGAQGKEDRHEERGAKLEEKEGKKPNHERAKRESPRIVEWGARIEERGTGQGEKERERDQRTSIRGKDPKIRIKRGPVNPDPEAIKALSDED
jgi:uncharacterized Fe-S cluster-containing radical SAM superfamily protein